MIDLFSGLGGASRAFRERGWTVLTLDINPEFNPEYCMDIRDFHIYQPFCIDLVWASPPCTDFSKRSMPPTWACNKGSHKEPDMSLLKETIRVINEIKPQWWVIENVQGAVEYFKPYLGDYRKKIGSRYLWGEFPIFDCDPGYGKWKMRPSTDRAAKRSLIPYQISKALCMAIEQELKIGEESWKRKNS